MLELGHEGGKGGRGRGTERGRGGGRGVDFDPARPHLAAMKLAGNHFSLFLGSTLEICFEAIIRSGGGLL